jgi:hypothetical protein
MLGGPPQRVVGDRGPRVSKTSAEGRQPRKCYELRPRKRVAVGAVEEKAEVGLGGDPSVHLAHALLHAQLQSNQGCRNAALRPTMMCARYAGPAELFCLVPQIWVNLSCMVEWLAIEL